MKISSRIASKQWERAAIDQLSLDLIAQGFSVETNVKLNDAIADLVAKKGNELIVYEVKVPGAVSESKKDFSLERLQAEAKRMGARFRLIVVRLPHETEVYINGLELALEQYLNENLPREIVSISEDVSILDVDGIEFASVTIEGGLVIEGQGDLLIKFGSDSRILNLPFYFKADFVNESKSDLPLAVHEMQSIRIDTSSIEI